MLFLERGAASKDDGEDCRRDDAEERLAQEGRQRQPLHDGGDVDRVTYKAVRPARDGRLPGEIDDPAAPPRAQRPGRPGRRRVGREKERQGRQGEPRIGRSRPHRVENDQPGEEACEQPFSRGLVGLAHHAAAGDEGGGAAAGKQQGADRLQQVIEEEGPADRVYDRAQKLPKKLELMASLNLLVSAVKAFSSAGAVSIGSIETIFMNFEPA